VNQAGHFTASVNTAVGENKFKLRVSDVSSNSTHHTVIGIRCKFTN